MTDPDHLISTRAVYDHSARWYAEQVGTRIDPAFETAHDRKVLDTYADDVLAGGGGPILDIGCGPGRATRHLADLGVEISGIDLSPEMVAIARTAHPELHFDVGTLSDLPADDRSSAGAVLWYSIIHTPPVDLPSAWAEIARVLRDGALVLIAFQAGASDVIERPEAYGSSDTLTLYRHSIDGVARTLEDAGFEITERHLRERELAHETTPQGFLRARKRSA